MERICHCLGEHRTYHTHTLIYQRQYHRVGGQDGDLGKSPRLKNILTFDQKTLFFVQFCYLAPVISFFQAARHILMILIGYKIYFRNAR